MSKYESIKSSNYWRRQPIAKERRRFIASLETVKKDTRFRHLILMESLYARDTPTAHERKLKIVGRDRVIEDGQVTLQSNAKQRTSETLDELLETSTDASVRADAETAVESAAISNNHEYGFNYSSLPKDLEHQWQTQCLDGKDLPEADEKTEERRRAELSDESISTYESEEVNDKLTDAIQPEAMHQPRRIGVASVPRRAKPAITINTGSGPTSFGAKRPPPTPVSPPTFSWNDILRVQNLIERCLQQYLSKVTSLLSISLSFLSNFLFCQAE